MFGVTQIAHLIGPTVGLKDTPFKDLFPAWARPTVEDGVPETVRADLRVGIHLKLVSQELLDAIDE